MMTYRVAGLNERTTLLQLFDQQFCVCDIAVPPDGTTNRDLLQQPTATHITQ